MMSVCLFLSPHRHRLHDCSIPPLFLCFVWFIEVCSGDLGGGTRIGLSIDLSGYIGTCYCLVWISYSLLFLLVYLSLLDC
ncbi:hypothetical protein BJX96DRAFT_9977 [Aspergillus floccosus]